MGTATLAPHQPLSTRAWGRRSPILSTKAPRLQVAAGADVPCHGPDLGTQGHRARSTSHTHPLTKVTVPVSRRAPGSLGPCRHLTRHLSRNRAPPAAPRPDLGTTWASQGPHPRNSPETQLQVRGKARAGHSSCETRVQGPTQALLSRSHQPCGAVVLPSSRDMSLHRETSPTPAGVPARQLLPVPASVGFLRLFSAESADRQGAGPGRPLLGWRGGAHAPESWPYRRVTLKVRGTKTRAHALLHPPGRQTHPVSGDSCWSHLWSNLGLLAVATFRMICPPVSIVLGTESVPSNLPSTPLMG